METLAHESRIPRPPGEVFAWHLRPGAFERLLPPWEDVRVLERTGGVEPGCRVTVRVSRGPAHFDWTVEHTEVEEGRSFTDEQVDGPFRSWSHRHSFEDDGDGGCIVRDEIRWKAPLGSLGALFTAPLVRRELRRLLAFRHRRLLHDLGRLAESAGDAWTVAITGASGLIGRSLTAFLRSGGHRVVSLVRSRDAEGDDAVYWNVEQGEIDSGRLDGIDCAIHLAGEPLFALRWTESKKEAILESRRRGTRLFAEALAGLDRGPRVLLSASGSHYYGDRGDEILTEDSGPGEGFLARVCSDWERGTEAAERAGIRVVRMRTGVVLTPEGGALEKMLLPFRTGLGGRLGSGRQYMSWIDADDYVGLAHHALVRRELSGAVNFVSPHPVTNATFTDTLGRVMGRPTAIPVPSPALKVGLGEMGEELLLQSQRARPEAARSSGFRFTFGDLEACMRHQLGRSGGSSDESGGGRDESGGAPDGGGGGSAFRDPATPATGSAPGDIGDGP